mmetsp:Transcript_63072/g.186335  ORF Transcript_63072/g.186335 Transcript_63072/m.186335 type:complete len:560 (+) Transcript_63072:493-2172(+)
MDVILNREGEGEIDHRFDVGDVESTGGNIGRHQYRDAPVLELGQRLRAGRLGLIAVYGRAVPSLLLESILQPLGLLLIQSEHEDAGSTLSPVLVIFVKAPQEDAQLVLPFPILDHLHSLLDALVGRQSSVPALVVHGILPDVHADGIDHILGREIRDARRPRRGEHGGPPSFLLGHGLGYDEAHVLLEPLIEHSVSLVQNQLTHAAQVDRTLVDEILETSRGGHDAIDPPTDLALLLVFGNSAVDDNGVQRYGGPYVLYDLVGLHGEFPRRGENEHAGFAAPSSSPISVFVFIVQGSQGRKCEGEGLTGTSLSNAHHVPPLPVAPLLHQHRPALRLNRARLLEFLLDRAPPQEGRRDAAIALPRPPEVIPRTVRRVAGNDCVSLDLLLLRRLGGPAEDDAMLLPPRRQVRRPSSFASGRFGRRFRIFSLVLLPPLLGTLVPAPLVGARPLSSPLPLLLLVLLVSLGQRHRFAVHGEFVAPLDHPLHGLDAHASSRRRTLVAVTPGVRFGIDLVGHRLDQFLHLHRAGILSLQSLLGSFHDRLLVGDGRHRSGGSYGDHS